MFIKYICYFKKTLKINYLRGGRGLARLHGGLRGMMMSLSQILIPQIWTGEKLQY